MFCCVLLYVHSSFAIILMGKRELVAFNRHEKVQDYLIEYWHTIYIMPVAFAEIYFWIKLNSILDIN